MLLRALAQTASLWEPIYLTYSWVHRAAHILKNEEDLRVEQLRREYRYLLSEMSSQRKQAGDLSGTVTLFMKVTKSYWKGLFQCYRFLPTYHAPTTTWNTASDLRAMANEELAAGREHPLLWWSEAACAWWPP
jgi:hypothetical protein